MSFPQSVNSEITDSISQVNTAVLGDNPAIAMGNLFQATAQALGMMYQNSVSTQNQLNTTAQNATDQGVAILYSLDTSNNSVTASNI